MTGYKWIVRQALKDAVAGVKYAALAMLSPALRRLLSVLIKIVGIPCLRHCPGWVVISYVEDVYLRLVGLSMRSCK